ncbi:hypothetical protein [Chamaesiphon sp. GL140_3_metabinner_50]|nr:hypothetical protein [Chamaesiphon sp. GL140_3_metabinner_50]
MNQISSFQTAQHNCTIKSDRDGRWELVEISWLAKIEHRTSTQRR